MDIPFESLIYRLSHPPKSQSQASGGASVLLTPSSIFASWLNHLPKPLAAGSGKHLFRLLYPHEGSRRRYGLKETKLAIELERILGAKGLSKWDGVALEDAEAGTGCLGKEVEMFMRSRVARGAKSSLTLASVDKLLDQLAASSTFSQLSQPPVHFANPSEILTTLFRDSALSPYASAVLVQIILRDLRSLLDPLPQLPIRNPTAMLRLKSTAGPAQLELLDAMRIWDPEMRELYLGGMGNLDKCAGIVEAMRRGPGGRFPGSSGAISGPRIGVNVQVSAQILLNDFAPDIDIRDNAQLSQNPKCRKGRSVHDALDEFTGSAYASPAQEVWAETKYDGYRMQIHVEVRHGMPNITIFSKSKRDSTFDRLNTHAIILSALGLEAETCLPQHPALATRIAETPGSSKPVKQSLILEAEVVPYNEGHREGARGPGIEEFWHLEGAGVTVVSRPPHNDAFPPYHDNGRHRHLCLVFFDILHLDGESLLTTPYETRRRHLEETVGIIPGFSLLAERTLISLRNGRQAALDKESSGIAIPDVKVGKTRAEVVQEAKDSLSEGLVLKAAESTYINMTWRWVKLKDYIPNLGDCIDLVLLGAGWDIDRARELRVDTSVITTFYLGVLSNPEAVKAKRQVPHFEILFRSSYGPTREQLEVYNENIRLGQWGNKPFDRDDPWKKRLIGLSWTYRFPVGMKPPCLLFERPLCAEIMGAGFQKLPGSELFELRWPRLQKIFDPRERAWTDASSADELVHTAHLALGYDLSATAVPRSPDHDSLRALWRSSSTQAVDIPDTPSPTESRPSPKRVQSAPDIREVLKTSPPSPIFGTPRQRRAEESHAARRMWEAMRGNDEGGRRAEVVVLRTSVTSPIKRRLGSPVIFPAKRPREDVPVPLSAEEAVGRAPLPTPPPSSPILRSEQVRPPQRRSPSPGRTVPPPQPLLPALPLPDREPDIAIEELLRQARKPISQKLTPSATIEQARRILGKSVSLRSRIKLAARKRVAIAVCG